MNRFKVNHGSESVILRVKLDVAGLLFSSGGLSISTICDNEASVTRYRQSGSEIEDIATLGTYATPTAGKCRFKEVSSANHPRLYELQLPNARFGVDGAKNMTITFTGAGINAAGIDIFVDFDVPDVNVESMDPGALETGGYVPVKRNFPSA